MNNYFLEGSDLAGRSIEIEKIISKEGFSLATTSIYDLENKDLSDVLEDLDTYGLFSTSDRISYERKSFKSIRYCVSLICLSNNCSTVSHSSDFHVSESIFNALSFQLKHQANNITAKERTTIRFFFIC